MPTKYNRRDYDDSGPAGILRKIGMPFLYISAVLSGIAGMISMGIFVHYWTEWHGEGCFLYSQPPSHQITYSFGSVGHNCHFVTYGGIPSLIIFFVCGFLHWFGVANQKGVPKKLIFIVVAMFIGTLLMLAVSCTLTEGMRITCASIGFVPANSKYEGCYEQLDTRADTRRGMIINASTMIPVAMGCLWASTSCAIVLTATHILSLNRRSMEEED